MTTTSDNGLLTFLEFVSGVASGSKKSYMKYGSYEELVLIEGHHMEQLLPIPDVQRGVMGECYRNSQLFVMDNSEFTYCEGWAISARLPIPLQHAWVIDGDGKVIDPTWDDEAHYYGIPFETEFLVDFTLNVGYYGILGNDYLNDCALLRWGVEGKVKQ